MKNGTSNPKWIVTASTVSAFTMFLPSIHEVRRSDPNSTVAKDCRFGYGLALGWSFLVGIVVASDESPEAALAAWVATAGLLVIIYESLIRSNASDKVTE